MLHHLLFLKPSIEGVSVTTENLVFKLIYGVTCPLFLAFGVIFYTRICFLDPINCVSNSTESFKVLRAIDSYCLENSYIVLESDQPSNIRTDSSKIQMEGLDDTSNRLYQSNYQYVGIFFVICGALCYLPYVLWEWFENGLLKCLLQDFMAVIVPETDDGKHSASRIKQTRQLSDFWKKNGRILETYAFAHIFCEVLNFVCVVFIYVLMNDFMDGYFATFGITSTRNEAVFPKSANCSWSTVGPSGKPVIYQGVCTMNLNYLSEKMFYFSWWWIAAAATLCIANLVYRYSVFGNPDLRSSIIKNGSLGFPICSRSADQEADDDSKRVDSYLKEISYADFFMVKRIQANVMPDTFQRILSHLSVYNNPSKSSYKEE